MSTGQRDSRSLPSLITSSGSALRSILRTSKLPLPGFAELENTTRILIDDLKTSGYTDDECRLLAMRLERLTRFVCLSGTSQNAEISEISKQLREIRERFEKESTKCRSRPSIFSAERRLQVLANIRQEIDDFVDDAQLRLSAQSHQAQTKQLMADRVPTIPEYEITGQEMMYEGIYKGAATGYAHVTKRLTLTDKDGLVNVHVNTRRGKYGKLSVIYKTYSSHLNENAASKAAKTQLECLSRMLHPNVTSLVGITKGYYGISGVIVASSGVSHYDFLSQISNGATLTTYIRGLQAAFEYASPYMSLYSGQSYANISVEPNGRVIVFPILEGENTSDHSVPFDTSLFFGNGPKSRPSEQQNINPVTQLAMSMYGHNTIGRVGQTHLSHFLDRIATLDWLSFTELEITRLAAKCGMYPMQRIYLWTGETPPPFTIELNDIGRVLDYGNGSFGWDMLQEKEDSKPIQHFFFCGDGNRDHNPIQYPTSTCCLELENEWISCPVCTCEGGLVEWVGSCSPLPWCQFAEQARLTANQRGIEPKEISHCSLLFGTVYFHPPPANKAGVTQALYFHRKPSSRTNLREYWGFLSTSADPCAPMTELERLGWRVKYTSEFSTHCIADGWDLKYEEMLRSGLASIPGGYPGSQIEEVLDEEQ